MPQPDSCFIDSNVWIYALTIQDDPSKTQQADQLINSYTTSAISTQVINEASDVVEQYWQPRNGKYLLKRLVERGDTIVAQSLAKFELAVDAIFRLTTPTLFHPP